MKRLRPFVDFNYDLRKNLDIELSAAEKNKISRYYNQVSKLYGQETTIYRPKRRDNIKAAKQASGLSGSEFKAYPIPSPTGKGRVKVTKRGISIETSGAMTRTIVLNMRKLILDPLSYIESVTDPNKYYIVNSKYDWNASGRASVIAKKLAGIIEAYKWALDDGEDEDGEDDKKAVFPIYLIEVDFKSQQTIDDYIRARATAQKARGKRGKKKANKKGR